MYANILHNKGHGYLDTKMYVFIVNISFNACCPLLWYNMLSYCSVILSGNNTTT